MRTGVTVFVSSTFTDMQPYRAAVREAVREALYRLEAVVRGMEYFGALPNTPRDECLRIVRGCQFYVGLIGMRYGSVDSESGKSFTHLVYEEAQRLGLPSLIYLIDEERQAVLPKNIDFGELGEKLRDFKAHLRAKHVVSLFTSPEDAAARLSQDLPALVERNGMPVNRNALTKLVESLPRVSWLTPERFAFLKKEVGEAAAIVPSDDVLREAMEFLLAGDRLAAVFLVARVAKIDLRDATDAMMEVEERIFAVVRRGTKLLEENGASQRGGGEA